MNEISEVLKSTREMSGVTIEEVSKDLDIPVLVLKQIEDGNMGAFKDIFLLRDYLTNYSKYLGLNPTEVVDEFNEFMFEVTSKIPMDEIEKAAKENNLKEDEREIVSPYTKIPTKTDSKQFIFMIILILVLVVLAVIWSIKQITIGNVTTNIISYFGN